ncbi:MAG: hypothetical protein QOH37_4051 [Nocardioidaceae bacterium]|jgi:streptogramin lyase|nr:hypothetical protein [Nocardioidaceae bacterium]
MSTASITHRPISFAAAGAAVAALAAIGVVIVSQDGTTTTPSPSGFAHPSVQTHQTHHFHPTTSGGRTLVGLP